MCYTRIKSTNVLLFEMTTYSDDDVLRVAGEWFKEGVEPYLSIDRMSTGVVYKAVLIEHGNRVQTEGKTWVEALLKAMLELRGYFG